jgi:hypothetical protein
MVPNEQVKTSKLGVSTHTHSSKDSKSCLGLWVRTLEDRVVSTPPPRVLFTDALSKLKTV